jgi:DNA-binding GntR family transcriptional regulator
MKTKTLFKRSFNLCLHLIAGRPVGTELGPETALADHLGISRTTVRAIIAAMERAGLLSVEGRQKLILRTPVDDDFFPEIETESIGAIVEKKFMEWTLRGDYRAGQQVNGLDLARQLGVSSSAIREYLTRFSQFGLLQRRPNNSWVFLGFDGPFANELCDIRDLLELRSVENFCDLPDNHPAWRKLDQLERQHLTLMTDIETRFADFSDLDETFHRLIHGASHNRFVENFHANMSLIFHYHYLWNKSDEKERNVVAIEEHLTYIAALRSRDKDAAVMTARTHLRTARSTLCHSIGGQPAEGALALPTTADSTARL